MRRGGVRESELEPEPGSSAEARGSPSALGKRGFRKIFSGRFAIESSRGGVLPLFGAEGPKKWGSARRRRAALEKFCLFSGKIRRPQVG